MSSEQTLSNRLIKKLSISFLLIIIIMGVTYILTSLYFSNKFITETTQKLNGKVAEHLVEEKFQNNNPFLEDGSVNKPLFGDIMHDMMAVNRGIEVYLLDLEGNILYSVVLDHSNPNEPAKQVSTAPIKEFIANNGDVFIEGNDPRNVGEQNIFSAAKFNKNGKEGYIYIILASQEYQSVSQSLLSSYFMKLGLGATILTMVFALLIGWLSVWFLTKNLRNIIYHVRRFREGDIESRIVNPEKSDLSTLAITYNEMADTISKNIESIKSVDVLRRELVANISHDLRTPLAIMQGYIETLQIKKEQLKPKEQEEYINIIDKNIKQLTKLVTQLFEYSKFEAQQIKPEKEPFAITDLIYDIEAKYRVLAKEKNITLKTTVNGEISLVFADIALVERAIQNLIDNALKFTPKEGEINIELSNDNSNVFIQVKDTGSGISDEKAKVIFERFRQLDDKEKKSGVGLGLAIVKKIMELHNTTISIRNNETQGSIFEFYLPKHVV